MKKILTIIVSTILFLILIGICVGLILDSAEIFASFFFIATLSVLG